MHARGLQNVVRASPNPVSSMRIRLSLLLAALLLPAAPVAGQNAAGTADAGRIAVAARPAPVARPSTANGEVRIDGLIDEPAWEAAPLISGFVAVEPIEGGTPTRDTHVRILFDDDAIYVAARLWDHPDSITRVMNRRDEGG